MHNGVFITVVFHSMIKKIISTLLISLLGLQMVSAAVTNSAIISAYFQGPTITNVTATSAQVSLSSRILENLSGEDKSRVYFQYHETNQVCIMIYPTPEHCLPKKTAVGVTSATLINLKPNTAYSVVYKMDNTVMCITAPCPGNDFESLIAEFNTLPDASSTPVTGTITKNLGLGSRGKQVTILQTILIQQGYMNGIATGYFGVVTFKAVKAFQRAHNILPIGLVGPLTRKALSGSGVSVGIVEKFEGTITAYSTQCFVDGICSITVDDKVIVTTRGWSQEIVGKVIGVDDFGSVEKKIGSRAEVYAKKTADGYTLYGSADYYIKIK